MEGDATAIVWIMGIVIATTIGVIVTGISLWVRWISGRVIELGKQMVQVSERNNFDFSRIEKMEEQLKCLPEMKRTLGRLEGMLKDKMNGKG